MNISSARGVEFAHFLDLQRRLPGNAPAERFVTGLPRNQVIRRKSYASRDFDQRLRLTATDPADLLCGGVERKAHAL
jgi:hypothetical protein